MLIQMGELTFTPIHLPNCPIVKQQIKVANRVQDT